jgi:hypothetical protein
LTTLALDYGGQALPLAWCRWSGKLHGRHWQQIEGLFASAERLLPAPVVVADRGIACPTLIRLIEQHHWDYLVRVNRNVTLRQRPQSDELGGLLGRTRNSPQPGLHNTIDVIVLAQTNMCGSAANAVPGSAWPRRTAGW